MHLRRLLVRSAVCALALGVLVPVSSLAQTFAAGSAAQPVIPTGPLDRTHRISTGHGRSDDEQQMFGRVRDGVYTVDGMVAKLKLNYDIEGAKHVFFFVPGLGTAVLSTARDPKGVVTEVKLVNDELRFDAGEHHFKLTGVALANNRGGAPEHLYVRLDQAAWQLSKYPMLGFGDAAEAPYQWPGALPAAADAPMTAEAKQIVPPVPVSLLPSPRPVRPGSTVTATAAPLRTATSQPLAVQ